MNLVLNIGLAREGNSNIGVGTVLREIYRVGKLVTYSVHHSDTEATVVAFVAAGSDYRAQVEFLSVLLSQDCIAVYDVDTKAGELIGPKAAEWGEFNPEYFVLFDGSRLVQPAVQAAA